MIKHTFCVPDRAVNMKFGEASYDLLCDLLTNLNKTNKCKLRNVSTGGPTFRDERLTELVFLMTRALKLDPAVGYHAVEILQKFIARHLSGLFDGPSAPGGAADSVHASEDGMLDLLKEKFPVLVFSCVQLSSKLSFLGHIIDLDTAVSFLRSVGHDVSKRALLESELMVLKGLQFRMSDPHPMTYVEVLLEVLGHNQPSLPVERLYELCRPVLQFVSLERRAVFDSLLALVTRCASPSGEQREKFLAVTEDYMLLGVGVIAVASFVHCFSRWEEVVGELSHITGISSGSIGDFARVTLALIAPAPSPAPGRSLDPPPSSQCVFDVVTPNRC